MDLVTGAMLTPCQPAEHGDSAIMPCDSGGSWVPRDGNGGAPGTGGPDETVTEAGVEQVVADKSYNSKQVLQDLAEVGVLPANRRARTEAASRGLDRGRYQIPPTEPQGQDPVLGNLHHTRRRRLPPPVLAAPDVRRLSAPVSRGTTDWLFLKLRSSLACLVPRLTLLLFGAAKDVPEAAKMVTAGTARLHFHWQANGQTRSCIQAALRPLKKCTTNETSATINKR